MFEYELIKEASEKGKQRLQTAFIIGGFVIFAVILVAILYSIVKKIKGDDLVQESKKDIDKDNLTLNTSDYEQIASSLYNSMQGWTTNESNIYRNIDRLNTADDWKQLIVAFGEKDGMNLVEYLTDELDNSEISTVNQILSKFNQSI